MKTAFILSLSILVYCFSLTGQVCFSTPTANNFPIGQNNRAIISDDFNNDGKPDMAANNFSSNSVSILLGNGLGGVTSNTTIAVTYSPYDLASADFNNDNNKDIASLNSSFGNVTLLIGNGTGSFSTTTTFTTYSNPKSIKTADVNGDGKSDLIVVAGTTANNITFYYGDGTGNFPTNSSISTGVNIWDILKADFNGDANMDLAITTYSASNNIAVLLGNGAGMFTPSASSLTLSYPGNLTSADYNGDGIRDLITTYDISKDKIAVLLGSGTGSFSLSTTLNTFNGATSIISPDINNDGKVDVLTSHGSNGFVNVLTGDGTGNFAASSPIARGGNPQALLANDCNSDGLTDLAVLNSNSTEGKIALLLGVPGNVFNPVSIFTTSGSTGETLSEDFNNDGNPDIAVTDYQTGVSVIYGDGAGNALSIVSYPVGSSVVSLTAGDFNKDGLIDIGALLGNSNNARLLLNNGSGGGFSLQPALSIGSLPLSLRKGDFNNDGNLDIVAANSGFTTVTVRFGNGLGGFDPAIPVTVGSQPNFVTVGDFNNDGFDDLVTTNNLSNNLSIVLSTGTGSFSAASTFTMVGKPADLSGYDFNNDGNLDIAVGSNTSNMVIFFGNGAGGFSSPNYIPASSAIYVQSLLIKDYNGDGIQDIILAHNNTATSSISVLAGLGFGTFASPLSITTCTSSYGLGASDFNKDGKLDLLVTSRNQLSVNVLFNQAPTLTLSAATVSVCAGNTVALSASGASTYTWTNGITNGSPFTPTASAVFSVTGSNSCGYSTTSATVTLLQTPTLTASVSSASVCNGTSVILNAIGANTYTWSGGATNGLTFVPTASGTYTVYGENTCGVSSATVDLTVDNACQDVWPGDANSDGWADNLDVLEMGLHYLQTGPARPSGLNNIWQPFYSDNWAGTITNGKNVNHSDCNGDGTINDDDTLAIYNNYGLTHSFRQNAQIATISELSIVPDQSSVVKGNWGTASIYLGETSTPVNDINGVAFTVNFDNSLIDPNSMWIEYPSSFINSANQNLHFRKLDFANSNLFTATTHTINNNVSGDGLIGILHYKILSGLTTDEVLNIGLVQGYKSEISGLITPLTVGTGTLMAIGASVGVSESSHANVVSINPNPSNGIIIIRSKTELQKIELIAVTGQILLSEVPVSTSHILRLDQLANGVYFVNVYQSDRVVKREKIILNK